MRDGSSELSVTLKHRKAGIKVGILFFILLFLFPLSVADADALVIGKDGNFKGRIDNVRVYSRALTEEEVKEDYYSNFYKDPLSRWGFDIKKEGIAHGAHTYQGMAIDESANKGSTEIRMLTINSRPTHSSPVIFSAYQKNSTDEDLTCLAQEINDEDGDTVTYIVRWYKNEVEQLALRNLSIVSSGNLSVGDRWSCSITPYDSIEYGETKSSAVLTVLCVDTDGDKVCDTSEPDECIGQNTDNIPPDTDCADWSFDSNGCHSKIILNPPGTIIGEEDCTSHVRWSEHYPEGCWKFINITRRCGDDGKVLAGSCSVEYACEYDADIDLTLCASHFSKDWQSYEAKCHANGDSGCWDENIAVWHPSKDTACCGDDTPEEGKDYEECWADDTNHSGCCFGAYITEPDDNAGLCNSIGIKKGFNQGVCDKDGEEYCYATALGDASQDADCCCCGDDVNETWSIFASGRRLEDIIVGGRCQKGKWVQRTTSALTLYDLWASITK